MTSIRLSAEEIFHGLDGYVAADVGDGVSQGDLFGADFDAVLCEATLLDAAVAREGAQALFLEDLAGGVVVEELDLRDGGRADEVCLFVELRADFHAAAAGDAVRERVIGFLLLGEDARAGAEIVGAVDGDPGFDAHEVLEEDGAVDLKIADERKFRQRLDADGLLEIFNEGGARHAGFAVDPHRAGAADFFEAIRVVGDRRGGAAVGGDGVGGDLHHGGDDVHAGAPFEFKLLPYSGCIGAGLALDFELYGLGWHVSFRNCRRG